MYDNKYIVKIVVALARDLFLKKSVLNNKIYVLGLLRKNNIKKRRLQVRYKLPLR